MFYSLLFGISGGVCHQLPERSLWIGGLQLPFCARCTGIYATACLLMTGLPLSGLPRRNKWKHTVSAGRRTVTRWGIAAAVLISALEIDGLGNLLGLWQSSAAIRFATGAAFGIGLPLLLILAQGYDLSNGAFTLPAGIVHKLIFLSAAAVAVSVLICSGLLPGMLAGAVTVAGMLLLFSSVVSVLLNKMKKGGKRPALRSFLLSCCLIISLAIVRRL